MVKKKLLLFSVFLILQISLLAQSKLEINIQLQNVSFASLVTELEIQSGYLFSYDAKLISSRKKYSLNKQHASLQEALLAWLTPLDLTYSIQGKQIILFRLKKNEIVMSGTVRDAKSGELLKGVPLRILQTNRTNHILTNSYGYFSLSKLIKEPVTVNIEFPDYEDFSLNWVPSDDSILDIYLRPKIKVVLQTIKVSANVFGLGLPTSSNYPEYRVKQILATPLIAGESDPLKSMQYLPGIKSGIHGTMDIYVRGGTKGENLILLDDAPIYNAGHLLGTVSIFNTRALKDIKIQKENFNPEYGGRASSVIDMQMKEGDLHQFHSEVGIGLISSNISLEGPIINGKSSFFLNARRSFMDQYSKLTSTEVPYNFYDLNGKINFIINSSNRLFVSLYNGRDKLNAIINELEYDQRQKLTIKAAMGNLSNTIRWNHIARNRKKFFNLSFIQSLNQLDFQILKQALPEYSIYSDINDKSVKLDIDNFSLSRHKLKYGAQYSYRQFRPNFENSVQYASKQLRYYAHEAAIYLQDEFSITPKLMANGGLRLSSNTNKKMYFNFEPRLGVQYAIHTNGKVKLSYSKMTQYMHLIANNNLATLPTDFWMPANESLKPLQSHQIALSYVTAIPSWSMVLGIESFLKKQSNVTEISNAPFVFTNANIINQVQTGTAHSHGLELYIHKTMGKFKSMVSYSWSKSLRRFEAINSGNEYPSNFDKTHEFSMVGSYDIFAWFTFSGVYVYATGAPFTPQVGTYIYPYPNLNGYATVPILGERNSMRFRNANRLDIELVFRRNKKSFNKSELKIGVHNVFNRIQPNFMVSNPSGNIASFQQIGLFGIVPYLTYYHRINFKHE